MQRLSTIAIATMSLLVLGSGLPAGIALGQDKVEQTPNLGRIAAASQVFIAAIAARDIHAMDKIWAHGRVARRDFTSGRSQNRA